MSLSDVFIRRPVFTTMLSVLLVVLGFIGLRRLGTDLFPEVSFPFVSVLTVYPGAGPSEIEQQIVKPIEDTVAGINGVDAIQSFSRENVGLVLVQFKLSVNSDKAAQEVRDKIGGIQMLLPRDAKLPQIDRVDFSAAPILTFAVSANLPSTELRQLIKDKLEPAFSQLEGVAQVRVRGGDAREIRVDVDLDRAKAAGVAPGQLAERLGMENLDVPAGKLELGPTDLNVRALGQFKTLDEIRALPIVRTQSGGSVRLDEVATVVDGIADRTAIARLNGKDAVIIEIVKRPGANTVEVAHMVEHRMKELEPTMGSGFASNVIIDNAIYIEENAKEVWVALIFGGLMAVIIILIFLLDPRGTFISSLALPTSVIGTFFVMYVLGYTLNQMTLLALSLAIGLLIDDAVVVRESITHRLEQGESPEDAASHGTQDVYLAVLATTLSLVAVFIPVAFMPGIVGQFFKQFGITISVAVLISLFVSFSLDPMLSARLSKQRLKGQAHKEGFIARMFRGAFEATERLYERVLRWTLRNRLITAVLSFVSVIGVGGWAATHVSVAFMAPEDRSQFMVELEMPESTSLGEAGERAAIAEALLRKVVPDITSIYMFAGDDGFNGKANKARLRVLVKPRNERSMLLEEMQAAARKSLTGELQATKVTLLDPPTIEGLGDFFPMMISVMGPDLKVAEEEAKRLAAVLNGLDGPQDVRVVTNPPRSELAISIDRTRANDTGVTSAMLGMQLRLAMNGQVTGKLREGSRETDIVVRLSEKDRASPEQLKMMDVFTPVGVRSVSDIATIATRDAPSTIEHFNRERRVMVLANMKPGADLGKVSSDLKAKMKAEPPRAGYSLYYDGQMKSLDEQNEAFGFALVLAVIFTYMVLASQFEHLLHPFTILTSVPPAIVAGLASLVVTGFSFTLGAAIGFILLVGLVTKNAILLVDQSLQNLRAGMELHEAIILAGPRRLRPILMTSFAMAIGMAPTALGRGQGFEFRAPMAIAVIAGVLGSTFSTLIIVPLVFEFVQRFSAFVIWLLDQIGFGGVFHRAKAAASAPPPHAPAATPPEAPVGAATPEAP